MRSERASAYRSARYERRHRFVQLSHPAAQNRVTILVTAFAHMYDSCERALSYVAGASLILGARTITPAAASLIDLRDRSRDTYSYRRLPTGKQVSHSVLFAASRIDHATQCDRRQTHLRVGRYHFAAAARAKTPIEWAAHRNKARGALASLSSESAETGALIDGSTFGYFLRTINRDERKQCRSRRLDIVSAQSV